MAEVTLEMLQLRLGRQYLFAHHGDCEHALVFTDCWLATDADVRPRSDYPLPAFKRKGAGNNNRCGVCARAVAIWECHGDRLADCSPCHLCQVCHFQFHYSADDGGGGGTALRNDYTRFPLFSQYM